MEPTVDRSGKFRTLNATVTVTVTQLSCPGSFHNDRSRVEGHVNPPFPDLRHDLLSCGIVRAQGNIIAAFFARPPLVFKTDEAISGARWDVKYMVDFASKRQIVELGSSEKVDYEVGEHPFEFKIDAIDFAGVNKRYYFAERTAVLETQMLLDCKFCSDTCQLFNVVKRFKQCEKQPLFYNNWFAMPADGQEIVQISMVTQVVLQSTAVKDWKEQDGRLFGGYNRHD
eukprot:1194271-Prorocentrum_minimum.AAC.3